MMFVMPYNKFVRSNKFIVEENDKCTTLKIMEKNLRRFLNTDLM